MRNLGNDKVLLDEYNEILEANKRIFSKLKSDGIMEETPRSNDKKDSS